MMLPTVYGLIDRRILVNFRADPNVVAPLLPAPFRPKLIHGASIVGICLIRLKNVRPAFVPAGLGIASENAAHRIAVEWDEGGGVREGVFIPRRDTNSRFNSLVGGRLFPGVHHHARFTVVETAETFAIALESDDGDTSMSVRGRRSERLPAASVFASVDEASEFFRGGALGYSASREPGRFQGLELRCREWRVEPLEVESVHSSFFEDATRFPPESIEFDNALLMREIEHEWHSRGELVSGCGQGLDKGRPQGFFAISKNS